MKRVLLLVVALVLVASAQLFGQQAAGGFIEPGQVIRSPADIYPLRLDVFKVYSHSQGYRVIYRRSGFEMGEVFIPMSWFVAGGKAALIRQTGPVVPYMVIYYTSDQEFSHVKLFVHASLAHESWGRMTGDPGERFMVDTLSIQF